jgi:hypothetical protein
LATLADRPDVGLRLIGSDAPKLRLLLSRIINSSKTIGNICEQYEGGGKQQADVWIRLALADGATGKLTHMGDLSSATTRALTSTAGEFLLSGPAAADAKSDHRELARGRRVAGGDGHYSLAAR